MKRPTRRAFLGAAAAFPYVITRNVRGANDTLNVAGIGAGGKGTRDLAGVAGENIVALCDPDDARASASFRKYPKARRYKDFRDMLEKEKSIDAVTVSAPDHMHAVAGVMAMKMGKHVYGQKPLTHDVYEARVMADTAREMKVATQMGNQGHSHSGSRRLVELIRAGVLGRVKEIHVWTDRPIWPQGIDRPKDTPPVPGALDWDLWLGTAPERPYHPAYVPFKWRGWWDFGTGALGDMGCHNMDLAFFSLGLRDPISVEATHSGDNGDAAPKWAVITTVFPERDGRPQVPLTWYDGGKKPPADLVKLRELPKNGVIMVGEKDTLFVPNIWGDGTFLSGAKTADFKDIPRTLPRRDVFDQGHYDEWIEACKGGPAALSNFGYAGPMTEAVLLGNVAIRAGRKIEWDAKALKVTNVAEANRYIRREYRKGWSL